MLILSFPDDTSAC